MATAAENKTAKRLKILDAANRLFLDRSVAETAIDDVVKLAGVAKGTFYLYFRDKTDLLDQIVIRHTAEIFLRCCGALREKTNPQAMTASEQLIFLTDEIASFLGRNRKVTALIDNRLSALFTAEAYSEVPQFQSEIERLTALLCEKGLTAEQALRQLYVLAHTALGVCCDAILGAQPYTLDEILPTVHDMIRRVTEGGKSA